MSGGPAGVGGERTCCDVAKSVAWLKMKFVGKSENLPHLGHNVCCVCVLITNYQHICCIKKSIIIGGSASETHEVCERGAGNARMTRGGERERQRETKTRSRREIR